MLKKGTFMRISSLFSLQLLRFPLGMFFFSINNTPFALSIAYGYRNEAKLCTLFFKQRFVDSVSENVYLSWIFMAFCFCYAYGVFIQAVLLVYPFLWLKLYLQLFKQRKSKLGTAEKHQGKRKRMWNSLQSSPQRYVYLYPCLCYRSMCF